MNMLFLFYTFFLLIFILLLILSMKIQIKIENFKYQSELTKENTHIAPGYRMIIYLYVLNKIPIVRLKLTPSKFFKINQKTHIKEKMMEQMKMPNMVRLTEKYDIKKDLKEIAKYMKLETHELELKIELGTENVILTSFLIPVVSTVIAIVIAKTKYQMNQQNFKVTPIYESKNIIHLQVDGTFELKIIHILTTFWMIKQKRNAGKNEKTEKNSVYDIPEIAHDF